MPRFDVLFIRWKAWIGILQYSHPSIIICRVFAVDSILAEVLLCGSWCSIVRKACRRRSIFYFLDSSRCGGNVLLDRHFIIIWSSPQRSLSILVHQANCPPLRTLGNKEAFVLSSIQEDCIAQGRRTPFFFESCLRVRNDYCSGDPTLFNAK